MRCARLFDAPQEGNYRHVLALDTALGTSGVTYYDSHDNRCVSKIREDERGQAQFLVPMVQEVLAEAGIEFADLEVIVTSVGPGSFTGLRVGLSTARSFGTALTIPVIGISTLDLIALQTLEKTDDLTGENTVHVVLETKRDDFYYRFYDFASGKHGSAEAVSGEKIKEYLTDNKGVLSGNATERLLDLTGKIEGLDVVDVMQSDTELLAALIDHPQWHLPADPVYLRGADISQGKRKNRELV